MTGPMPTMPTVTTAVLEQRPARLTDATPPLKAMTRSLDFHYGTVQALKRIDLPVHDRSVTALIGPSGCGKSTLLRCFNRMHDLYPGNRYGGEIRLYPDDVNLLDAAVDPIEVRMRLAMVFQKPNPFPKSIYENVAYGPRIHGLARGKAELDAAAKTEPRLVALNLVGPEDGNTALSSYDREMEMLGYLHGAYAGQSPLHVSLHAGELAAKYLPSGYTIPNINHIKKAVEVAHAERIGHGVDVMSETNPTALLTELQQLGVMVEIGLSSNVQILEVSGGAHPLANYLQAGVPVALATDDQGVARSSMTGEYLRAVQDQNLDYRTLKARQLLVTGPDLLSQLAARHDGTAPVGEVDLRRWLQSGDYPFLAPSLDKVRSAARKDQRELGFNQLRLVLATLRDETEWVEELLRADRIARKGLPRNEGQPHATPVAVGQSSSKINPRRGR